MKNIIRFIILFVTISLPQSGLAQAPDWSVEPNVHHYQNVMNITAVVLVECIESADPNDILCVYDSTGMCRGVSNLEVSLDGRQFATLTVYSNATEAEKLHFKLYDASLNLIYTTVSTEVEFISNQILGDFDAPFEVVTNNAPTDITLSHLLVDEHQPAGTLVGILSTIDLDTTDVYSYAFASGEGDTDNDLFIIEDGTLRTDTTFDALTQSVYSVRIETISAACTFEKVFTITIVDINDFPSDILLSPDSIFESMPNGTLVGYLSSVDLDTGDLHTYTLVNGPGDTNNGKFYIEGNALRSRPLLDFEKNRFEEIRVQTDDGFGGVFERSLIITVLDNNEPDEIILSPIPANQELQVRIILLDGRETDILVYNMAGQMVQHTSFSGVAGMNLVKVPTYNLPHGIYFLFFRGPDYKAYSRRFVVEHHE